MPDPTPMDALTAPCSECGAPADEHDGTEDAPWACSLSWLDVLRRLADPTWPDNGGKPAWLVITDEDEVATPAAGSQIFLHYVRPVVAAPGEGDDR